MNGSEKQPERPKVQTFKVSEEEYEALRMLAEVHGVAVADVLRERLDMDGLIEEARRVEKAVLDRAG